MDLYYHPVSPPSWSVMLLGRQLGLELNLKKVDFEGQAHLQEDFIKLNPTHTVPTLVDGDFVLTESRAILSYLMDAHAKEDHPLYPRDAKTRALIQHRLDFDLGTLYRWFYDYCSPMWKSKSIGTKEQLEKVHEALGFLETYLGESRFTVGDSLTIADVSLTASMSALEICYFSFEKYPKVQEWFSTCKKELVGYQDVIESQREVLRKFVGEQRHP